MLSLLFNFWWQKRIQSSRGGGVDVWYDGAVTASIWRYVWPNPLKGRNDRRGWWLMAMKKARGSRTRVGYCSQMVKVLGLLLDSPVYCLFAGTHNWRNDRMIAVFITEIKTGWFGPEPQRQSDPTQFFSFIPLWCFHMSYISVFC